MAKLEAIVEWLFLRGSPLSSILRIAFLVAFVPVLLALPFIGRNMEHHHTRAAASGAASARESVLPLQPTSALAGRPLYPYSVIPGGVRGAAELRNAIAHDPVVAQHYADFDVAKTHVVRLDHDQMDYVSYRLGDRIFWTKKELTIRKGETLITDGTHEARTRCGNRLSENAAQPTSAAQPSPEVLSSPAAAPASAASEVAPELLAPNYFPEVIPGGGRSPLLAPGGGTPGGPTGSIVPPAYFPIVGGGAPSGSTRPVTPPPVGTPEPSSILMLAIGLGSIFFFALRRKRQS
jgi:PEP-CTERM motif